MTNVKLINRQRETERAMLLLAALKSNVQMAVGVIFISHMPVRQEAFYKI